jgi:hypothetical protein
VTYISGPISSDDPEIQKKNLARFYEVERILSDRGDKCFNPARLEEDHRSWEYYLARDLTWIIRSYPDMYMMKGWQNSRGARLEHEVALYLNLKIEYE